MSNSESFFHLGDIGAEQIPALKRNCDHAGGRLRIQNEGEGGNFTVTCLRPAPAAPATAPMSLSAGGTGSSAMAAAVTAGAAVNPNKRDVDPAHLHPVVRAKVAAIQKQLDAENIPMKVFEAFRSPHRQAHLFAKGRTAPGNKVTNAKAWQSYHQYGVAVDFVRFENGKWNWNTGTASERAQWDRYHQIARDNGLEPLSFEKPHVQLADYSLTRLMNGDYPDGGDASWAENLSAAILGWGDGAPPLPDDAPRPAMAVAPATVSGGGLNWHSMFGGDAWAYDDKGVYTMGPGGQIKTWRTPGAPITVQEVISLHGNAIQKASAKHGVSQELIVMTIATETAIFRRDGFTGPKTFRWEQGFTVGATGDSALDGKEKGDYSAGPMQVMSDTARWTNNRLGLGYNNARDFKFFKNRPSSAPTKLGLYDPEICIDIGAAFIRINMDKTGDDPLLVAAAYNAGGIRPSSKNHWRIRSHGNHLDRAAEWYGDACSVLKD